MALLKRKRSGLSDPMSVVTRFVNACNRHDADSVAACLHPDFDSIQPMYPSRNFRGADQVRRNWAAIFEAEPGFRLTVLRQAGSDDTVWLELHGAGRDAEVAGIFVMGVQGDRIRWARIYSALIEPLPEGMVDPVASSPANLRQVPPLDDGSGASAPPAPPAPASDTAVEEDLIAPVVDIDGGERRRRRRSSRRRGGHEGAEAESTATGDAEDEAASDAATETETAAPAGDVIAPVNVAQPVDLIEPVAAGTDHAAADMEPVAGAEVAGAEVAGAEVAAQAVVDAPAAAEAGAQPTAAASAAEAVPASAADGEAPGAAVSEAREPEIVAPPESEPTQAWAGPPVPDAAPAPSDIDGDDIIWAELTPDDRDPAPESPTEEGRPGKRRGRKRR